MVCEEERGRYIKAMGEEEEKRSDYSRDDEKRREGPGEMED